MIAAAAPPAPENVPAVIPTYLTKGDMLAIYGTGTVTYLVYVLVLNVKKLNCQIAFYSKTRRYPSCLLGNCQNAAYSKTAVGTNGTVPTPFGNCQITAY